MTVYESKLKTGTLVLGAASPGPQLTVHTQASNVRITPEREEDGDPLELLSGDVLAADSVSTWTLAANILQDFDNEAGVIAYSWEHDGETVPFEWQPNATAPTYTGNVVVEALEVGGDVNRRNFSDLEWSITAKPTVTYPV